MYCPFHNDNEWRRLKEEEPEAFDRAVRFEKEYQATYAAIPTVVGTPYLHKSLQPLSDVDFTVKDDGQLSLFGNECTGMCGV